jgi:NAD(P)H dehydrogenase (quinone)
MWAVRFVFPVPLASWATDLSKTVAAGLPLVDLARSEAMVVVAHPDPTSLNHALAHAVFGALTEAGLDTTLFDLHTEGFNPVLTRAEARGAASDDRHIQHHISALKRASFLAVVHPICWGAPPAMMKGWMDRVFAPGAAYAFSKASDAGDTPLGLLGVKSALVINTSNTLEQREVNAFGDPLERIWRDCLLGYCGVARTDRRVFRVVATSTAEERTSWIAEARALAGAAAQRIAWGR